MNNPIDPEELRLRDAVVSAAEDWANCYNGTNAEELRGRLKLLADHRTKASAPVVPERCEPVRCEFVNEIGNRIVIEVIVGRVDELPFFSITGPHSKIESYVTRKELTALAETIQKATPGPRPDIRGEPTLSEVRKIWHDHFGARCSHPNADADIMGFAHTLLSQHSNPISGETPTIESVRELVEKMPRGTIWKTQLDELVEYTKAAVVRFGVGR